MPWNRELSIRAAVYTLCDQTDRRLEILDVIPALGTVRLIHVEMCFAKVSNSVL